MDSGERWRLGHRPALDGLRGVAILLVLLAHFDNPTTNPFSGAGMVGVTVFFTLSGFLITSLLLDERERTGRTSLRAFYRRRVRRLMPALWATVLAVLIVQASGRTMGVSPKMAGSALLSASNWWQIDHGFFSGLAHTWSLGIEEQFYLVWPALLLLGMRRGRRGVAALATLGILASVVAVIAPGGDSLHGSLERAASLLAGCLLAVWMTGRREHRGRPVLAAGALAAMVPALWLDPEQLAWVYVLVVPALTVVVLFSVASGPGPAWLSGSVLGWFGKRSYGIYLWHYPVLTMFPVAAGAPWALPYVGLFGLSLLVAELSWRLIEQRFLRKPQYVPPARRLTVRGQWRVGPKPPLFTGG